LPTGKPHRLQAIFDDVNLGHAAILREGSLDEHDICIVVVD
jgi:hypothetical protein